MKKEIIKVNDKELENVTGGVDHDVLDSETGKKYSEAERRFSAPKSEWSLPDSSFEDSIPE